MASEPPSGPELDRSMVLRWRAPYTGRAKNKTTDRLSSNEEQNHPDTASTSRASSAGASRSRPPTLVDDWISQHCPGYQRVAAPDSPADHGSLDTSSRGPADDPLALHLQKQSSLLMAALQDPFEAANEAQAVSIAAPILHIRILAPDDGQTPPAQVLTAPELFAQLRTFCRANPQHKSTFSQPKADIGDQTATVWMSARAFIPGQGDETLYKEYILRIFWRKLRRPTQLDVLDEPQNAEAPDPEHADSIHNLARWRWMGHEFMSAGGDGTFEPVW